MKCLGIFVLFLSINHVVFAMEQEQFSYEKATTQDTQSLLELINNIQPLAQEYPWRS